MINLTVDVLADLAQEVEVTDQIDWSNLNVDRETAYKLIASNVLEQFNNIEEDQQLTVALASVTKLLVEDFILNLVAEAGYLHGKEV